MIDFGRGDQCFVHQHPQQRGAGAKSNPHSKGGVLIGSDYSSPAWYVWLPQEEELVYSGHITFKREDKILDLVGEVGSLDLNDDDDIDNSSEHDSIHKRKEHDED